MTSQFDSVAAVYEPGVTPWVLNPFLEKVTGIAPCLIYVFNHETQSNEYSNRNIGETLGYSPEEICDMGSALMPMLLHSDDVGAVLEHFDKIKQLDDGDIAVVEYRMKHRNGHWVWLLSQDTVFQRNDGLEVISHIGSATDITRQKHAMSVAEQAREKSIAINDELRAFAYAMSHDMKAPSNTLGLLLSELKGSEGTPLHEGQAALLDMAMSTVSRMGLMIEDILAYTAVIGQDVVFETVDLAKTVEDVLAFLSADISDADATVRVGDLQSVVASKLQLSILLQNLIQNALKFRSKSVPTVVTVETADDDVQNAVTLTVRDNGIGIPADQHRRIFQPFGRLHNAAKYAGTGLGLPICRRIASNHGSSINLVSEVGQGAAFSIRLRCASKKGEGTN